MIETLLSTVFLTIMAFAALQLVIMIVNDICMNEAAFTLSRVCMVSKTPDIEGRIKKLAPIFTIKDVYLKSMGFDPYKLPTETQGQTGAHSGTNVMVYNMNIRYFQNIMFGNLLGGNGVTANMINDTARARTVKSPQEEYYDKAYSGAPNF